MTHDREAYRAACEAADKIAAMHGRVVDNWCWRDGQLQTQSHPKPKRGEATLL